MDALYNALLQHADQGTILIPVNRAVAALREMALRIEHGDVQVHQLKVSKTAGRNTSPLTTVTYVFTEDHRRPTPEEEMMQ